jgi:molybdenum cofactor cytidylyltransferase
MGCILKQGGGLYTRVRVGAVLLAAGQGQRMGNIPKSLIELGGVPLINRQLIALSGGGVDEVVVVTGFYHEQIEPLVEQFPVRVVRNPHPEEGQASSVRLGLEALGEAFDAVIMALADQPLINAEDVAQLIVAFKKRPAGEIVMPVVDGQRGNPIILSGKALKDILDSGQNMVCRKFMDQNPELVHPFETPNQHFVLDLDEPQDIEKFEANTGWKLTLPKVKSALDESSNQAVPAYLALQKLLNT